MSVTVYPSRGAKEVVKRASGGAYFNSGQAIGNLDLAAAGFDSNKLVFHGWIDVVSVLADWQYYFSAGAADLFLRMSSGGQLQFRCEGTSEGASLYLYCDASPTATSGWQSVDIVIDTTQDYGVVYLDLVEVERIVVNPTIGNGNTILIDVNDYQFGARSSATQPIDAQIHQFGLWNSFSSEYISDGGILMPKYLASMYDFDPEGAHYPKYGSLAAAIGVEPVWLFEGAQNGGTPDNWGVNSGATGSLPSEWGGGPSAIISGREVPQGRWSYIVW